ncbi:MAG: redox-sensing transcriptional repressor Rex [Armatimonadetes bacterium]|jgi:redox-sensing transcriptional repressor|nr:redox-sensing transcriptional repressor Rex [Armatimonadota bacterium]
MVPEPTVLRLPMYLQALREIQSEGVSVVSSEEFGQRVDASAAQFRKDLSYIGELGRPGVGYDVAALILRIAEILGLTQPHPLVLVGAGRLGAALCSYPGFAEQGFRIAAVFDNDPTKMGRRLGENVIRDIADLPRVNAALGCRMGIVAVPGCVARDVVQAMVEAGIGWILNFAPVAVGAPKGATIRQVDLTHQLEVLSYYMTVAKHGTDPEA